MLMLHFFLSLFLNNMYNFSYSFLTSIACMMRGATSSLYLVHSFYPSSIFYLYLSLWQVYLSMAYENRYTDAVTVANWLTGMMWLNLWVK
jgi:hypothetical protein